MRARHQQKRHVYFSQATLSKVAAAAWTQARKQVREAGNDEPLYHVAPGKRFLEWLRFDQYRKLLIFKSVHKYLVVTDISNFFDSILYGRIEQSLCGLRASPKIVGLLFFLLEHLSPRESYTPSQRIGLPVDQFDCSRNLAHMILFPHDERIVALVGEEAFVRWMDDQNVGVNSRAEGLRVLSAIGSSLSRLHLTPNSSKSRILTLAEAKRHFHFRANALLDVIDKMPYDTSAQRRSLRAALLDVWEKASDDEGRGEWEKILKRVYRYAARARARFLRRRAMRDVLTYPSLTARICEYLSYTSTVFECLNFAQSILTHPEQVYPDVSYKMLDSLLQLEPTPSEAKALRNFFKSVSAAQISFPGQVLARSLVPLALLRYGDKRSVKSLVALLRGSLDKLSTEEVRSVSLVLAGFGQQEFETIQTTAGRLLVNHLSEFVRMVQRIRQLTDVPNRLKLRIHLSKDPITSKQYIDMRTILTMRLLGLNRHHDVKQWLSSKINLFRNAPVSDFDKSLLERFFS